MGETPRWAQPQVRRNVNQEHPSKSQRVQDYLRANPQTRNRDVVKALEEYGVTAADVSNAKAQLKKKHTRRRSRAAAVVAATAATGGVVATDESGNSISMVEIEATIDYVQAVGGIARAQQLLAIIQQIQQMN